MSRVQEAISRSIRSPRPDNLTQEDPFFKQKLSSMTNLLYLWQKPKSYREEWTDFELQVSSDVAGRAKQTDMVIS